MAVQRSGWVGGPEGQDLEIWGRKDLEREGTPMTTTGSVRVG